MKTAKNLLLLTLLVLLLSGCFGAEYSASRRKTAVSYARQHEETIISCSEMLLSNYAKQDDALLITQVDGSLFRLYSYHAEEAEEVELPELQQLFDSGVIHCVTLRSYSVEYDVGGTGIASNTTYRELNYIPSDQIQDLFGYSDKIPLEFDKATGGYGGRKPNSDNTFYYFKIRENLYYTEASF